MMSDIKSEPGDPGICCGCLSLDRKLASVQNLTSCNLYYSLLTEDQKIPKVEDLSVHQVNLCWECIALLRRTQKFQAQIQRAYSILQNSLNFLESTPTLSSLTVHQILEYDHILEEDQAQEVTHDDKIIIPSKYKCSNIENVKSFKDVINDLLTNVTYKKITKVEELRNDSYGCEDNEDFKADTSDNDDNYLSNDNYAIKEDESFKDDRNAPSDVKKDAIKEIKALESSNINDTKDNDNQPKTKNQKTADLDPDFDVKDCEYCESDVSEEYRRIGLKKLSETSETNDKQQRVTTQYYTMAAAIPYFTEIEMSQQDIKSTLEKNDAIVDEKTKNKPLKCTVCGWMTRRCYSLTYHAAKLHKSKYPNQMKKGSWCNPAPVFPQKSVWRCDVCSRILRKEHIVTHMNEYHRTKYFCNKQGCEWCPRPFWNKEDLCQHHDEIHKKFKCNYCNKKMRSKVRLENHMRDTHDLRVVSIECKICMKAFSSYKYLKQHLIRIHETVKEPAELRYCVECDVTFKCIAAFKKHFSSKHSGKDKPKWPCKHCGKVMADRYTHQRHVDLIHTGITKYRCHICGKYLSKLQALQLHLDRHNNIKPPRNKPCLICGRMFQTNRILRNHMCTHTGERPYKCPHCVSAFTQAHCLRTHLAKQHQVDAVVRYNGTIVMETTENKTNENVNC